MSSSTDCVDNILNTPEEKIIKYHKKICHQTGSNINNNNPQACGTSSNAVLSLYIKTNNLKLKNTNSINNYFSNVMYNYDNNGAICRVSLDSCSVYNVFTDEKEYFYGHAFIIIKLDFNSYVILQSYIDEYYLSECQKYTKIFYTRHQVKNILRQCMKIHKKNGFTKHSAKFWKKFTGVPIDDLVDCFSKKKKLVIDLWYSPKSK